MAAWAWPGSRVTRAVDGDTVDAIVTRDLGFGGVAMFPVRLRLNRINTPKVSTVRGRAARDRVGALVLGVVVDIVTVAPYKYGGPDDQAGEWMAEVTLPDAQNLSDVLVAEGLAVYWSGAGPRPDDS